MDLSAVDNSAIWLTLKLALYTTLTLLVVATPLAWWLANTRSRIRHGVSALVAMPLVLPPTVLGFYLLVMLGPQGTLGQLTQTLGLGLLPFTFGGLVVASVIYSLPFAVQPIHGAFEQLGRRPMEAAATLRASPIDRFFSIALPMARPGLLTATVLTFAHTVGEFGVVLMLGGNIDGETRVLSVAIYDHVESLEYSQAHVLSIGLIVFSFSALLLLQLYSKRKWQPV
ncbi:molybdate ABC transporter permease subunit [Ketobacter alkanivorans]|uniref:Molybdenum transport system permease n=1 Tax=Ketobacter alkanivorans TaxID=1917421 RepID=A0A2K9LJI4_9GAMM|nr:molybdate ABC transporter permease subunit [Ketobacter alkanivorans]AUM11665.1 molybdate ABC transporter permease subunit [Ketobacter alkanivorans]